MSKQKPILDSSWAPQWSDLKGHWKMNNDWNDTTGVNNGTAVNGASFTGVRKLGSYAGNFDGSDDEVQLSPSSSLLTGDSSFTIVTWFKNSTLYTTADQNYGARFLTLMRSPTSSKLIRMLRLTIVIFRTRTLLITSLRLRDARPLQIMNSLFISY